MKKQFAVMGVYTSPDNAVWLVATVMRVFETRAAAERAIKQAEKGADSDYIRLDGKQYWNFGPVLWVQTVFQL